MLDLASKPRKHGKVVVRTIWGELAWQLGGEECFAMVKEADENGTAPGKGALAEARDELRWRRWVYPRRVVDGVMKAAEADRKIALQEAIVANLQEQVEAEQAAGDLFRRQELAQRLRAVH